MAVTNPTTSNVSTTVAVATGFTVNVTSCNLNPNLNEKDFLILVNGTPVVNTNWAKTNQTTLTYSGPNLTIGHSLEVRRKTPPNLLNLAEFGTRISSAEFNDEFERQARINYENELNGVGPGSSVTVATPKDDAFGAGWDGDVSFPPTRNAVYDWGIGRAPLASPAFTGNPTAPTQTAGTNNTTLANTQFVGNALSGFAPLASPTFTGVPVAPTPATTDVSTKLATTSYVDARISNRGKMLVQTLEYASTANITAPTFGVGADVSIFTTPTFSVQTGDTVKFTLGIAGVGTNTAATAFARINLFTRFNATAATPSRTQGTTLYIGVFGAASFAGANSVAFGETVNISAATAGSMLVDLRASMNGLQTAVLLPFTMFVEIYR